MEAILPQVAPRRWRERLFPNGEWILLLALAAEIALFSVIAENFFSWNNFFEVVRFSVELGLLALAITPIIITGGIDLSVGCLMTFCAVAAGVVLSSWHLPLWTSLVAAVGVGALSGTVSGTLVAKLKIPPFIATLGMMLVNKGLALVVSADKPIYFVDTPSFSQISQGSVIGYILPSVPIPNGVLILFVLAFAASVVLNRTALGRYTFALGSNEEAVRLSGVNVDAWKIAIYGLGGAICGIAGILIASRLNSAQPALGQGYELEAIAAVVIGGTSLSGGTGTILGTIIGAFIMSVLTNGLRILSVAQEWQIVVTGLIIILAVYADILRRRRI